MCEVDYVKSRLHYGDHLSMWFMKEDYIIVSINMQLHTVAQATGNGFFFKYHLVIGTTGICSENGQQVEIFHAFWTYHNQKWHYLWIEVMN